MADATDFGFSLLPADDEGVPAAVAVDAAATSALEDVAGLPDAQDDSIPFGRTWSFDWERGQFRREGFSPATVSGIEALKQWCLMALYTARFAHPIFSDEFGMERLEDVIGEVDAGERLLDYEQRMAEALLVHDRIVAVENFDADYDTTTGVLTLYSFDVVTDEEDRLSFSNVTVPTTG